MNFEINCDKIGTSRYYINKDIKIYTEQEIIVIIFLIPSMSIIIVQAAQWGEIIYMS